MSILCEIDVIFPVYNIVSGSFQITFYIVITLIVHLIQLFFLPTF